MLTSRPFRSQRRDLPTVGPECLHCKEPIRISPKWQTQGYLHAKCQLLAAQEHEKTAGEKSIWPTEDDRKQLHQQYIQQQGKEVNWYDDSVQ